MLPLQKFKFLFLKNMLYGVRIIFRNTFRYKFYVSYVKFVKSKFRVSKSVFGMKSKFIFFRRLRRFWTKKLRLRFSGYRQKIKHMYDLRSSANRALVFYSLFKRNLGTSSFDSFFLHGLQFITSCFVKKMRYIKRKLNLVTYNISY